MTNLLRRALRRLLDFAYRLDREAMWQQWERDHVQPLRGHVEIVTQAAKDWMEDAQRAWKAAEEKDQAIAELNARIKAMDATKPWYRR